MLLCHRWCRPQGGSGAVSAAARHNAAGDDWLPHCWSRVHGLHCGGDMQREQQLQRLQETILQIKELAGKRSSCTLAGTLFGSTLLHDSCSSARVGDFHKTGEHLNCTGIMQTALVVIMCVIFACYFCCCRWRAPLLPPAWTRTGSWP
jgi:hypothetical protein